MNLFLAVDIGSSFVKAALFDLDKDSILEQIKLHSPTKDKVDDQNKYEVKVSLYLDLVKQVLETFTSKYKDIKGLLLSTQQHGFVYDYGEECKYISWQDQRCIEVCSENKTYL
ncbi:MAG: FGGY family carbohydrate kinase, partial [Succinatimonas sp.]|nr:FGGY family carbohydrate kinase [Succinatimonas sp.]